MRARALLQAVPTPEPTPEPVRRVQRVPVALSPIAWGRADRVMGAVVCRHVLDATPPIEIPFLPRIDRKLRATLAQMGLRA